MRLVWVSKGDFELFHQDINPYEYEYFRNHIGTFKRMWHDQTPEFWTVFLRTFDHFLWHYGVMRDFPMTVEETRGYIDEILMYIKSHFVDGRVSTAKGLIMDCVIVTQNRNCIVLMDKGSYSQNPFFMKETREVFRKLFGAPDEQKTYLKLLCGLQVYIKFAGAVVIMLRRWLEAAEIESDDELAKASYLSKLYDITLDTHHGVKKRMWGENEVRKMIEEIEPRPKTGEKMSAKVNDAKDEVVKKKKKKKPKSLVNNKQVVPPTDKLTTPTDKTDKRASGTSVDPPSKSLNDKHPLKDTPSLEKHSVDKTAKVSSAMNEPPLSKESSQNKDKTTAFRDASEEPSSKDSNAAFRDASKEPSSKDSNAAFRDASKEPSSKDSNAAFRDASKEPSLKDSNAVFRDASKEPSSKDSNAVFRDASKGPSSKDSNAVFRDASKEPSSKDSNAVFRDAVSDLMSYYSSGPGSQMSASDVENSAPAVLQAACNKVMDAEPKDRVRQEMDTVTYAGTKEIMEKYLTSKDHVSSDDSHMTRTEDTKTTALPKDSDVMLSTSAPEPLLDNGQSSKDLSTPAISCQDGMAISGQDREGVSPFPTSGHEPGGVTEIDEGACMNDGLVGRKRLHVCHYCGAEETVAKNFKRCQKCRGRPNPSYYCSKECQVKHWKTHKLEHRAEPNVTG